MQLRTVVYTLASVALASPAALASAVTADSRVDAATVFPAAVTVHRTAHLHLAGGEHQVTFAALPAGLVDDTVRIGGFGAGVTAESVSVRTGRRAEVTGPEIDRLAAQLATLQRAQAQATAQRAELARRFAASASPAERRTLTNALDEATRRLADATTRMGECAVALERARAEGEQPVKFVSVDLAAAREGELDLSIEYLVPGGASWRPAYAARLDADASRVGLDVFAQVQQQTGEDWTGVRLSVSTVVPAAGLTLPTLTEQGIGLEPAPRVAMAFGQAARGGAVMPDLVPAAAPRAAAEAQAAPGNAVARPLPPPPIEQLTGLAQAPSHLLAARLEIPAPVSLRAGAPSRRFLATHSDLPSAVEYQAAPRQSNAVYLAARFRNANAFPLLAGPVALFIGADYVGTAALREAPIDEPVLLPFGADAGLTIDRTLASRALAVRAGHDETTLRYQYRLTNHRGRDVDVTVLEQTPVSHDHELTVSRAGGDLAPLAHQDGDPPGGLRWHLRAEAGATRRWTFAYLVSAPHGRAVEGAIE